MSNRWSQNAGLIGVDGQALFGVHNLRSVRQRVLDGNWTNAVINQSYTPTHETITLTEDVSGGTHSVQTPVSLNLQYIGNASSGNLTSGSSHTFTSQPIGTAASDRYVIVGCASYAANSAGLVSITIGGAAATPLRAYHSTTAGVALVTRNTQTGSTADIVLNINTASTDWNLAIAVWTVNASSFFYSADDATTGNITLSSNARGCPLIGVGMNVNGTAGTSSITNADSVTERFDFDIRSNEWFCGVDGVSNVPFGGSHTIDSGDASRRVAVMITDFA